MTTLVGGIFAEHFGGILGTGKLSVSGIAMLREWSLVRKSAGPQIRLNSVGALDILHPSYAIPA